MAQKFWLKLSFILLGGLLCFSFCLAWFFCVRQAQSLNAQQTLYETYLSRASFSTFQPESLFLSYFWPVLGFGLLAFVILFLFIFLYLRAFSHFAHFLFQLFGKRYQIERKKRFLILAIAVTFT